MKRMIALCAAFILALNLFAVLPASAAEGSGGGASTIDRLLTLEQTLALYGTEISGTYWDNLNQLNREITFTYLTDTDHIGNISLDSQNVKIGTAGRLSTAQRSLLQSTKYLVYVSTPDDWGGGNFVSTNGRTNIALHTSISLTGLNRFTQPVFWTLYQKDNHQNIISSTLSMYNGQNLILPSYNSPDYRSGVGWWTSSGSDVRSYFPLAMYAWNPSSEPQVDENYLGYFGGFCWEYLDEENQIAVNGMEMNMRNCGTVTNSGYVYLLVGCPYMHQTQVLPPEPEITTAPPTTTQLSTTRDYLDPAPHTTGTTSDLSGISVDLARIIRNQELQMEYQEWIGKNQQRAVNNLAYICDRLDKIYDLMKKQGDIQDPQETELGYWMNAQLSTSTTAKLPEEALEGVSFLTWMMTSFQSQLWLYTISMLSLACLTTYWFLFKGRH